jgi:hypothetical protein
VRSERGAAAVSDEFKSVQPQRVAVPTDGWRHESALVLLRQMVIGLGEVSAHGRQTGQDLRGRLLGGLQRPFRLGARGGRG